MSLGPSNYLAEIVDSASFVLSATRDLALMDYRDRRIVRRSVEHSLVSIGRSVHRLAAEDASAVARLGDWSRIVEFGKRLLHEYYDIDDADTWRVVQETIPDLKERAELLVLEGGTRD